MCVLNMVNMASIKATSFDQYRTDFLQTDLFTCAWEANVSSPVAEINASFPSYFTLSVISHG